MKDITKQIVAWDAWGPFLGARNSHGVGALASRFCDSVSRCGLALHRVPQEDCIDSKPRYYVSGELALLTAPPLPASR